MNYDVACVEDLGDKLRVKYVDNYENAMMKNDGVYVKISNTAADVINTAVRNGSLVYLPKNVNGELSFIDVVITEVDDLQKDIRIFLCEIYGRVNYQQFFVSAMDYFEYLNVFADLATLGIFVTNDNREEKYLEIIETGNEKLISKLETYLEKKDLLEGLSYAYNRSKLYERRAMECESKEQLDEVIEEFRNEK